MLVNTISKPNLHKGKQPRSLLVGEGDFKFLILPPQSLRDGACRTSQLLKLVRRQRDPLLAWLQLASRLQAQKNPALQGQAWVKGFRVMSQP